jgi:Tfp pilus assembly PilM family ATPase
MPQLLALEWDSNEARLAVAASRGNRVVIEQAFSVPLRAAAAADAEAVDAEAVEPDVGAQIAAALSARGIGHVDSVVAVGRSSIELRQLSLPPAPDEELPDMVRFQAMREFNALEDDWLLDFIPIDTAADGARTVLAAAIDADLVGQIQRTCETAGLKPQHLVLRPCAAASLFARSEPGGAEQLRLLVDLLADEADLTVMSGPRVVFLRTARLPGDPLVALDESPALLAEIRRNVAAAQNQLGGRRVEAAVLCGRGEQHAALARLIGANLGVPATLFDPFAGLHLGGGLRDATTEHPGRFAPLLGMLVAELEQTGHAIDFLHPRRRPVPPSRRRFYAGLAVAAGALVFAWLAFVQVQRYVLKSDLADLNAQLVARKAEAEKARKLAAPAVKIEEWRHSDLPWLDVLELISRKFPLAKETMALSVRFTANKSAKADQRGEIKSPRGEIKIDALAATPETIAAIQQQISTLYDARMGIEADNTHEYYKRKFHLDVTISPAKPALPAPKVEKK